MAFASTIGILLKGNLLSAPSISQAGRWMSSSKLFARGWSNSSDDRSLRIAFSGCRKVDHGRVIMTYASSEEASAAMTAMDGKVATKMSDEESTHDTEISGQELFDSTKESDPESNDCMEMRGEDLESEENLWDLYHRWQKFYMISRDHEDMLKRFNQFKETAKFVYEFNMNNYDPHVPSSCQMGLNMFSDMTDDELGCFKGYDPTHLRRELEETVSGGSHAESPI